MQTGIFLEISPLSAGGAPTAPGLAGILLCGGHGERAQPGIQSETQERGGAFGTPWGTVMDPWNQGMVEF